MYVKKTVYKHLSFVIKILYVIQDKLVFNICSGKIENDKLTNFVRMKNDIRLALWFLKKPTCSIFIFFQNYFCIFCKFRTWLLAKQVLRKSPGQQTEQKTFLIASLTPKTQAFLFSKSHSMTLHKSIIFLQKNCSEILNMEVLPFYET